jgi:hypothetical protein
MIDAAAALASTTDPGNQNPWIDFFQNVTEDNLHMMRSFSVSVTQYSQCCVYHVSKTLPSEFVLP